jgi:hypothetical protein
MTRIFLGRFIGGSFLVCCNGMRFWQGVGRTEDVEAGACRANGSGDRLVRALLTSRLTVHMSSIIQTISRQTK